MSLRSSFAYGVGSFAGWVLAGAWYAHLHNGDWGELGPLAALIGGIVFTVFFTGCSFAWGVVSRWLHGDPSPVDTLFGPGVAGLTFWPIVLPLHEYLRDGCGLPDLIWVPELLLISAGLLEAVRAISKLRAAA
jgi:hypothetical protein